MKGSRLCTDDLSHRRDQTLRFGGIAPEIPVFGNLADGLTSNPPVVALDENGVVTYAELVPEITIEPDYNVPV